MRNRHFVLGAIVAASLLVTTATLAISNIAAQPNQGNSQQQGQGNMMKDNSGNDERPSVQYALNKKYHDYNNGVFRVRVGGGSHVAPLTMFAPSHAEIKVGETVVFYNPTQVSEPHTVTFVLDNSSFADFAMPFTIDNQTKVESAIPNANSEPVTMPGPPGKNVIIALNSRSAMPTVIDSNGNVTNLPPNANYTVTGTEKYINSGWMWPQGQTPPGLPPIDSFTLTFSKGGTYSYICEIHPWMTGEVVVK